MKKNGNLHEARRIKNDEFYTMTKDIEAELQHYRPHFEGKVVFLNCDDPEWSNFWKFFEANFEFLKLKKLISTHHDDSKPTYKLEMTSVGITRTELTENGDFRSPESLKILYEESDVVVTNPPFSLFREYISILSSSGKKYLIVGSMNAITYKEVFPLIKDDKLWLGLNFLKEFTQPDGSIKKFGNICWYTNLEHSRRGDTVKTFQEYNPSMYPTYDNYPAIDVSKVVNIPESYQGEMGVPITFLTKYNPQQFEIIKFRKGDDGKDLSVNGKCPYFRIIIKYRGL